VKGGLQIVCLVADEGRFLRLRAVMRKCFPQHPARRLPPRTFSKACAAEDAVDARAFVAEAPLESLMNQIELRPGHGAARDLGLVCADRDRVAGLVEAADAFECTFDQRQVGGHLNVGRTVNDNDPIAIEKDEFHGAVSDI
jgi:hypothetical protein